MKPCLAIYMQSRKKEQPSTGIIHSKTGRDLIGQKVAGYRCARLLCKQQKMCVCVYNLDASTKTRVSERAL